MYIKKTYYNSILKDDFTEKARDDTFVPETVPSIIYRTWRAELDLRTCFDCATNHGRIFALNDPVAQKPPLHFGCRCTLDKMEAIEAGKATVNGIDGADYWIKYYGKLPKYYISPAQMEDLGWNFGDRPSQFVSGRMLGGGIYNNKNRILPVKAGRVWYEADINYTPGRRNLHRIVWSNDGLIFATYDHYHTFYEII